MLASTACSVMARGLGHRFLMVGYATTGEGKLAKKHTKLFADWILDIRYPLLKAAQKPGLMKVNEVFLVGKPNRAIWA